MNSQITRLSNGLRVVTWRNPHVQTAALGLWVASGARHESEREHGISHLLEHMAFKGTGTRSARAIAEEIEQVGGELNAATSLETTAYYARVLGKDVPLAMELLADILLDSRFAEEELAREREVILQEIAATRDSPDEIGYDLLQEAAYPRQSLGRPILGTPESVTRFTPADLSGHLATHYRGSALVLSAAGDVDHDRIVRAAEGLLAAFPSGASEAVEPARWQGGNRASSKPFEQAHVLIGWESPSYRDRSFIVGQVLSGLLGGGMSSRLFQEAREKRGLCYSIYSSCYGLADSGMFGVHAATSKEQLAELVDVVAVQLRDLATTPPPATELARAKAQLAAGLLMGLESSSARAEQMARHVMLFDRTIEAAELIERIDGVSAEDIRATAEQLWRSTAPTIVVVGAGRRSARLVEDAAFRLSSVA